ncbi:MAG: hypothetical protein IJ801_10120 [Lachnospiraceae bacterium]|nr:hypothetical protein [Lachnospiraceae bacterium]
MQTIEILDIKPFMQLLLQTDELDAYELVSAQLRTDMFYTLDGHIQPEFFSPQEKDELQLTDLVYLPWQFAKERMFALIRGKKTPSLLRIILKSNNRHIHSLLCATHSSLQPQDIDGMFLNILFQDKHLHITCGISYHIFTQDKTLEDEFTQQTLALLRSRQITFLS